MNTSYNEMPVFRVIVGGGRDFTNFKEGSFYINKAIARKIKTHRIEIVSGRARGADTIGEMFVKKFNTDNPNLKIGLKTFVPEWNNLEGDRVAIKINKFGKPYNSLAGFIRNEDMGNYSDGALLFWDGTSSGTKSMIDIMNKLKKPCIVYIYNPKTKSVLYQL